MLRKKKREQGQVVKKGTQYVQRTPVAVKYGQVNHDAAMQARPAGIVKTTTHHHQMLRSRRRLIKRRKKNRYAILTGTITNHQMVAAAFSSLEIFGSSSNRVNIKPPSAPLRITANESYCACIALYAKPVAQHKQMTAKRSKASSVENCLRKIARM